MVRGGHDLEALIGRILTLGVLFSMILLSLGLIVYVFQNGGLNLTFDESLVLSGENIFMVMRPLFKALLSRENPSRTFMALGILMLMVTQYVRVVASVLYFSMIRDLKYVVITLFVLTIITLSLLGYITG